jgi:hypothetical protein
MDLLHEKVCIVNEWYIEQLKHENALNVACIMRLSDEVSSLKCRVIQLRSACFVMFCGLVTAVTTLVFFSR